MRLTDYSFTKILRKERIARIQKARIEGVDHSLAERTIAEKIHLLILP